MAAPLVIGIDVRGDEELARSFREKGSAFQRAIMKRAKALGDVAKALARSSAPVRSGKSAASIYSRVGINRDGSVTLTVKPGKAGWRLAFSEFPQRSPTVKVSAYQRATARFRPVAAGKRFFAPTAGKGRVSAYQRANKLRFRPAIAPARDFLAEKAPQVMRDAVTEALKS